MMTNGNPDWIIVSFYTTGTGYEQEVEKLVKSINHFSLPSYIVPCKPMGSWRANLNNKSGVILDALDRFPGRDIVFIDADAVICKYPALFDKLSEDREHHMAAHFYSYQFSKDELLSGTLWFSNDDMGRMIVRKWHEVGLARPETRHQLCLKIALAMLENEQAGVKVYRLPIEYTCIFDSPARKGKEAVIEHFQASRRFRRQVGYGADMIRWKKGQPPTTPTRITVQDIEKVML